MSITRTLLLAAASVAAGGTATAETNAFDGTSTLEAESTLDGGSSTDSGSNSGRDVSVARTGPERSALQPRWIEPRRLEPVPFAEADGSGPSTGEPPEAASALPTATDPVGRQPVFDRGTSVGSNKDWRYAARIVIHGERVNDELSMLTAALLRTLGAEAVEHRRVRNSSDVDQIRYFDAADESMARELAAALKPEFGRVPVRDFTAYRPSPVSGLLEMWLR